MAADHLLSCGYKTIAFLGGRHNSNSHRERLKGFEKAFTHRDLPFLNGMQFFGEYSIEGGTGVPRRSSPRNQGWMESLPETM